MAGHALASTAVLVGPMTKEEIDRCRMARFLLEPPADGVCKRLIDTIDEVRATKDGAYTERNMVVAALARQFPSGIARTDIPGWDPEWHGIVYIDLPTGQVSWHYHDSHAHLFENLPAYTKPWDGHDTEEKYRRLAASYDSCRTMSPNPKGD